MTLEEKVAHLEARINFLEGRLNHMPSPYQNYYRGYGNPQYSQPGECKDQVYLSTSQYEQPGSGQ